MQKVSAGVLLIIALLVLLGIIRLALLIDWSYLLLAVILGAAVYFVYHFSKPHKRVALK